MTPPLAFSRGGLNRKKHINYNLPQSLPLEGKVGFAKQNSDEVEHIIRKLRFLHLISHLTVTASPQGEA